MKKKNIYNTGKQKNSKRVFLYSWAKRCSQHDAAFRFSLNQTVSLWLYVEIPIIAKFRRFTFYYTGQQKAIYIKNISEF